MIEIKNDLREYLYRRRIQVKDFAASIDYSPTQVSTVIHRRRKPGKKLARLIEKATNGIITASDLLNDVYGQPRMEEDNG
jgi:DNA-binding transcriptional regulator YdaS (Cro superfamily)